MKNKKYLISSLVIFISMTTIIRVNAQDIKTQSYHVAGVCGMCEDRIEAVALSMDGVKEAQWDAESQYLAVSFVPGEFNDFSMLQKIAKAGHDTDLFEADAEAYEKLPACCHYKDVENPHLKDLNTNYEGYLIGTVYERTAEGDLIPLIGANLFWEGTALGATTDSEGNFKLENSEGKHQIIVSYVGYKTDTIHAPHKLGSEVDIILSHANNLDVVEIVHRKKATEISMVNPIKVHKIGEEELMKAACCNLAESFETNPSVDVSFTDAVTGTRKIEMLGLAGKYVQITSESLPDVRALSSIHGLTYTPGPWIEGIQMNMGTGSVVNGHESITGQINVELKKPEKMDRLFVNLYANQEAKFETNIASSIKVSDKVSTALLFHGNVGNRGLDHNDDGFLDMPVGKQVIALNRWKFVGDNGMMGQLGVKATLVDKQSGQMESELPAGIDLWTASQKVNRYEAWLKTGKIFPDRPYASVGFQLQAIHHEQDYIFGTRPYDAVQQSLFANLIYQSIIGNSNHQYRSGITFKLDKIEEQISDVSYLRSEYVPGAYFEYTFKPDEKLSLVSGLRGDLHNDYGFFVTPRFNMKYAFTEETVARIAAGRGFRTANVFSENIGFFASARDYEIRANGSENPYGLDPEVGWNFGLNLTQQFQLGSAEAVFAIDLYHTSFENQIVVDVETPGQISFYNLKGRSYSNSIQVQVDVTPIEKFDIRMAYRFNDVKVDYDAGLLQKPLSSKHRAFINFGYVTENGWKFDLTTTWQGQKRIPDTSVNPEPYQMDAYSPDFYLMNAQVTKVWKEVFDLYVGGENLTNFKQENPILSAEDPFGNFFDSSLIWGPVFGRKLYVGLRYRMK